MVVASSTTATQRLLVRSLTTSTRRLTGSSSSSFSPSPSPSSPSSSSSFSATPSIHERQSRQRRPQSILHVADAGGATMAATMRAIELTKARRETTTSTSSSSSSSPQRAGAPRQPNATGGAGLGSLLSRRRRAQGVVYDQDAQEIGSIISSSSSSSSSTPAARESKTGGAPRFPRAASQGWNERRFEGQQPSSGDLSSFSSAFPPRERREGRTPSSSSSTGPRPPRSGPSSQARGRGPQRPPPTRGPNASRSSSPRDKKPSLEDETRSLTPLVAPKFVEVPTLNLSSLPPSKPVLTIKTSTNVKAYAAYLEAGAMSEKTNLGVRQQGVLMHAQGLLSRNPSVGLKQRQIVLDKVEEALR